MFDGEDCIRCRKHFKFEELTVAPGGLSICHACAKKLNPDDAEKRRCLADGATMSRELHDQVILDRCPSCGGVWLDGEDVELIRRLAREQQDVAVMTLMLALF